MIILRVIPSTGDEELDYWIDSNLSIAIVLAGILGAAGLRLVYRQIEMRKVALLVARLGVDAAGVIIASQIDPTNGVRNWVKYSNDVFSGGLIPDPLVVIDYMAESETKVRRHFGIDQAVRGFAVQGQGGMLRQGLSIGFSFSKKVFDRGIPEIRTFTL
mgnify:CR=1 FL=1